MMLHRAIRAGVLSASLAVPAIGIADDAMRAKIEGVIAADAETHWIAMVCHGHDTDGFAHALKSWDVGLLAVVDYLESTAGYSVDEVLDLRSRYGAGAIMPSRLFSESEMEAACDPQRARFDALLSDGLPDTLSQIRALVE